MNNICYNGLTGRFDSWMNDGRAFTDYRPSGDSHTDFLNQVKSVGCNANNNDIRAFFTDRFMYQLQATFPTSYDVRQNLITMTNKAIDAFIASVD